MPQISTALASESPVALLPNSCALFQLHGRNSRVATVAPQPDGRRAAQVPGRLAIVGGGVIGLELGSVWGRLGAKVLNPTLSVQSFCAALVASAAAVRFISA